MKIKRLKSQELNQKIESHPTEVGTVKGFDLKTTFILKCGITSWLRDFMTHRFFECPSAGPTSPSSGPRQTSWGLDANLKLTNSNWVSSTSDTLAQWQVRADWENPCCHICRNFWLIAVARLVLLSKKVKSGWLISDRLGRACLRPLVGRCRRFGLHENTSSSLLQTTFTSFTLKWNSATHWIHEMPLGNMDYWTIYDLIVIGNMLN